VPRFLLLLLAVLFCLPLLNSAQACCAPEASYSAIAPLSTDDTARTIFPGPTLAACQLVAGKSYRVTAWGTVAAGDVSDVTFDVALGSTIMAEVMMVSKGTYQSPWHLTGTFTIQSEGPVAGMAMSYLSAVIDSTPSTDVGSPPLVDTTVDSILSLNVAMSDSVWVNIRGWTVEPIASTTH